LAVLVFIPGSQLSPLALDAAMREALADSLAHIHSAAAKSMDVSDEACAACLSAIKRHRVEPGLFGRYYDAVFALQERHYAEAGKLFREIAALADQEPSFNVVPFTGAALGPDRERYARLIGLETEAAAALTAPDNDDWRNFQANVAAAMELIEEANPSLAAEFRALLVQVVAVGSASQSGGRGFSGASSFMLWGAVLLNAGRHRTRLDTLGGLVHEAAHQVLFGLSIESPLAENPVSERYGSPLRTDTRPMDGIFHATFVCARIFYAYARLRDAADCGLDDNERRMIDQRLRIYRQKFFDGLETLERFGRLSDSGRRMLSAATAFMESAN
jgi:HEXXH motif-containing protein